MARLWPMCSFCQTLLTGWSIPLSACLCTAHLYTELGMGSKRRDFSLTLILHPCSMTVLRTVQVSSKMTKGPPSVARFAGTCPKKDSSTLFLGDDHRWW